MKPTCDLTYVSKLHCVPMKQILKKSIKNNKALAKMEGYHAK